MKILGLNIASSSVNKNGRGWIDPKTHEFVYLPIEEFATLERPAPTYQELGFSDVRYPSLPVHLDPEFKTFTYGHVRRYGDQKLFQMALGDILFFYSTLDLLPSHRDWGIYIVGYFTVDYVCDTRRMNVKEIKKLDGFEENAHMRRVTPGVHLLVKGTSDSRLYTHAIRLSHPDDNRRLHPDFVGLLATVTGKPLGGAGWHRWLLYSESVGLAQALRANH